MTLKSIRLELARDHDFPEGSRAHGYHFVAPLRADGHIDLEAWKKVRERCVVRRFWPGAADEHGHLVHLGRGAGGEWAFHYDIVGDPNLDEPGYRFGAHAFVVGEYVSLKEQDSTLRTFRIASVQALA